MQNTRFLLTKLHLDSLSDKATAKEIKLALQELPKGSRALDDAYKEAVQRIESQKPGLQKLAKDVLSWIVCARGQLIMSELRYALAVELNTAELDEDNLPEVDDILAVCASLGTVDDETNIVRLVHYNTQEYFEHTPPIWAPHAEDIITRTCLTYLSFGSVVERSSADDLGCFERYGEHILLEYAAEYWATHDEKRWSESIETSILEFSRTRTG